MTENERYEHMIKAYQQNLLNNTGCGPGLLACIVIILMLVCSCTTVKYIPVETVRTEYKSKTDTFIQKDSVHVKDSVLIHAKGDTVLINHWHTEYVDRWRDKISTDTLIKVDSIQVPYPVEKKLTKWEQVKMDYGALAIGGSIVAIIMLLLRIIRWLRRKDV